MALKTPTPPIKNSTGKVKGVKAGGYAYAKPSAKPARPTRSSASDVAIITGSSVAGGVLLGSAIAGPVGAVVGGVIGAGAGLSTADWVQIRRRSPKK